MNETKECPICRGLGFDFSACDTCVKCGGTGKILLKNWTITVVSFRLPCRRQ
jgi:DnaJ-class molecular chaperone